MREVALAAGRPPTAYGQGRAEAEQSRGIFPRVDRERRVTRDRRRQDPESSAIVPVTPLVFFLQTHSCPNLQIIQCRALCSNDQFIRVTETETYTPCSHNFTLQQTNPYTLMHRQVHATTNKSIHIAVVDATERGKARTSEPQTASRSYICNLLQYTRAPSRCVMLLIILLLALDRLHDAVDRRRDVVHGREPAFVFHLRRCRQQTDRSARGER
jgi:hypothetical protein